MSGILLRDDNGFTMIEFLFAICILTIGMLGLLETANVAMKHDTSNKLRTQAVSLASRILADDRTRDLDAIVEVHETKSVKVGMNAVDFVINKYVEVMPSGNTKHVTVNINWQDRGYTKDYAVSTYIYQNQND